MPAYFFIAAAAVASIASLFFATLSYALRDMSRHRLAEQMTRFGKPDLLDPTIDNAADLIFVTALARLFSNIFVLVCILRLFHDERLPLIVQYLLATLLAGIVTLFASVVIPNAAAKYAGEAVIVAFAGPLHAMRRALTPVTRMTHFVDRLFSRATGVDDSPQPEQIEQEILSVVEEGEKDGVVDQGEREMIASVIEFQDMTAGQIMTTRPEIVAIGLPAALDDVKRVIEHSAHSRIPAYEGSLDQIVGILYARDLLRYIGAAAEQFDLKSVLRPAFFVPETKPVRDLLADFRLQKIHIAIVLDEYGSVAGLATIEDILELLVGEISDEHESHEPAVLKRLTDQTWEADARVPIDELNRTVGLSLPEDSGIETLGGFLATLHGNIPPVGSTIEQPGVKFTVLTAEPQKVNRVRIDLARVESA